MIEVELNRKVRLVVGKKSYEPGKVYEMDEKTFSVMSTKHFFTVLSPPKQGSKGGKK